MGTCRSGQNTGALLPYWGWYCHPLLLSWFLGEIDGACIVWVQFRQSVDQGEDFRRALPARFTDWMVPYQCMNISFEEERANGRYAGLQREFRPSAKVQDSFLGDCRRGFGVDEGPTAIEQFSPEFFRDVDCVQIRRAEGCHKEHEL